MGVSSENSRCLRCCATIRAKRRQRSIRHYQVDASSARKRNTPERSAQPAHQRREFEETMPTMSTDFIQKSQAITEVSQATGYGRFVIEKKMAELMGAGKIRLINDPGDGRRQLLRKEDVQVIIDALTPKF